jgi:hypothetical protein
MSGRGQVQGSRSEVLENMSSRFAEYLTYGEELYTSERL